MEAPTPWRTTSSDVRVIENRPDVRPISQAIKDRSTQALLGLRRVFSHRMRQPVQRAQLLGAEAVGGRDPERLPCSPSQKEDSSTLRVETSAKVKTVESNIFRPLAV